jgi:glucosamine--fructose-6-phosphate aminotransferase (isomerizing)
VRLAATELLDKLKSNIEEIVARDGRLIIFTSEDSAIQNTDIIQVIVLPTVQRLWTPFIYAAAMQLLAYHAAVLRNTDVDQPRSLAKSVTVE